QVGRNPTDNRPLPASEPRTDPPRVNSTLVTAASSSGGAVELHLPIGTTTFLKDFSSMPRRPATMNAPRTIRTVVVTIDAEDLDTPPTNQGIQQARFRPSDLVPWSDPYIAGLVRRLQDEVREA